MPPTCLGLGFFARMSRDDACGDCEDQRETANSSAQQNQFRAGILQERRQEKKEES